MAATAVTLLLAAPPTAALGCQAGTVIEGMPQVHDGDTLRGDMKIRLQGIAAPELKEAGGKQAGFFLRSLVGDRPVRCTLDAVATNISDDASGNAVVHLNGTVDQVTLLRVQAADLRPEDFIFVA